MPQSINLTPVHQTLKTAPTTLAQLWQDHTDLWLQLSWQPPQLKLWLACLPGIITHTTPDGEQTFQLEAASKATDFNLADEMAELLARAERPMPLAQLLNKLPAGMLVTETMLRIAAQADARLELKGPLVKLV